MSINNVELYSITPFKEDECWYLKLIYTMMKMVSILL